MNGALRSPWRHANSCRPSSRRGLWVLLAAFVVASPAVAAAQTTGSSFGGGSFSRRSSSTSAHGSGWGSSSSSSPSSGFTSSRRSSPSTGTSSSSWSSSGSGGSTYSGGSYTPTNPDGVYGTPGSGARKFAWFVLPILAVALLLIFMRGGRAKPQVVIQRRGSRTERMDVSVLQIAMDWRVRSFVQLELERMARSGDTASDAGLARLLRNVALLLRRCESAWRYAHVRNMTPTDDPEAAEQVFRSAVADARTRFRHEIVRSFAGSRTETAGPAKFDRQADGEGFVVVTLAVATWREITDVLQVSDLASLRDLLQQYVGIDGSTMGALEVVWSPAKEDDRMSSAELETLYPELQPIQGPCLGKTFCDHCGGPFAKELAACPHCGAPNAPAGTGPT